MLDFSHYAGFGINGATNPLVHNTVTLDPRERNQYGLPIPVVTFSWSESDHRMIAAGVRKQREIVEAAGAEASFSVADTAHLMGA